MDISPAKLLENRQKRVYRDVKETIKQACEHVDYGKALPDSSIFPLDLTGSLKKENLENLQNIYKDIVGLVNNQSKTIDESNYVPVVNGKKSNINADDFFPKVDKTPAIEAKGLKGIIKTLDFFVERFGGIKYEEEETFEDLATIYPFASLLHHGYMSNGKCFRKLSRNVFINDMTKTTLIFLGGAEKYRQIDMLFSASLGAMQGLPGIADCIAFYPDIMCAEYDFIGLGLRELLMEGRDGLAKAKLQCLGICGDDISGPRELLLQLMPFVMLEMCDVVKNLNDFGLCLTRASPNNFALDTNYNLRPVLMNLDCLKPKGCDFYNYDFPYSMLCMCAPEMVNNVTVTEEMSSYIIGKVINETLELAVNAPSTLTIVNPSKALKISYEVCSIIDILTDASPEERCPVRVLIEAIHNTLHCVASSE